MVRIADKFMFSISKQYSTALVKHIYLTVEIFLHHFMIVTMQTSYEQAINDYLPSNDDETIESIPRFSQVSSFTINAHGNHFDQHLEGEEGKYEVIQHLRSTIILY